MSLSQPPQKPELPAWVFFVLRVSSLAAVAVVAWLVMRCES
ncbi:hypothetical protein [Hymenobacter koreensis]